MNLTHPSTISRSGFKYWLGPDGALYQTDEHSLGARRWAMQHLDEEPPMTFGVRDLMRRGWIRLVTERSIIRVTGGEDASSPAPTPSQMRTLRSLSDRFRELNGTVPDVRVGAGDAPGVPDWFGPENPRMP